MKLLITIATEEIAQHTAGFLKIQRQYAEAQGYEHRLVGERYWKKLHPSFSKVHEIKRALEEGCEYVLWSDADVVFMDHNVDLAALLCSDYFMAAYHQKNWPNWVYLCAGLTVWKNTPGAKKFVDNWWQRCDSGYIKHVPWEQWYMDELVRECNYAGIRACSAHEIGSFCPEIWHDGTKWKPGMPTVHMAGPATWEKRAQVLKDIYERQIIRKR